jgi:hypothetical protein
MLVDHKIGPTLPPAHHLNFILAAELHPFILYSNILQQEKNTKIFL